MCGERDEVHICRVRVLAHGQYKSWRDMVAHAIHWELCQKYDLPVTENGMNIELRV